MGYGACDRCSEAYRSCDVSCGARLMGFLGLGIE